MIEIIPAIDVIGGRCVRLSQGDFSRRKEYGDPLETARMFADHGIRRLHLVDLDGAREKRMVNRKVLEQIAANTELLIDVGGGLRSDADVRMAFECGAHMVTAGSIAVNERETFLGWLHTYGPERILLGADFREGKIAVSGWSEQTDLMLNDFVGQYLEEGISGVICTDIERDGMLEGPSIDAYRELKRLFASIYLVASGGIGNMEDILTLEREGIDGVILGKSIYEGRILMKDLEEKIKKEN